MGEIGASANGTVSEEQPATPSAPLPTTELEKQLEAAAAAEQAEIDAKLAALRKKHEAFDATIKLYEPLNGNVLLRRLPSEEMSVGGVLLPEAAKKRPEEGVVIAAGPGRLSGTGTRIPMAVGVGDKVVYAPFTGNPVPRYHDEYYLVDESQILAISERGQPCAPPASAADSASAS